MGIPKFYRWLSERYPLINQPGGATVVPIIDNLYLDMNGIIHNCTHGNNPDVRLTEDEMILRIFTYLDKIFHIVKPQKLLFMAIDGVAPRAKMNQQRSRRFKAAKEAAAAAEKAEKAAAKTSDVAEDSKPPVFDSNCITPGTPFMVRLGAHFRFFVRKKIAEDVAWRRPTIIFSGHDVPGEGEHKIMEHIRWAKQAPGYPPNTRHCLYGLDADLIMLSLVTHEPHFCLLREVVSYTGGGKGQPAREALENPGESTFVLLQIGLLREYFELEFKPAQKMPFPFSVERVVDDFVLFCMLIGNDFLPPLPTVDIAEGSLETMFDLYKELLPELGGYLTHAGKLHRGRLEVFLHKLANLEAKVLQERALEAQSLDDKKRKKGPGETPAWASERVEGRRREERAAGPNAPPAGDEVPELGLGHGGRFAALAPGRGLELLAAVEGLEEEEVEEEVILAPLPAPPAADAEPAPEPAPGAGEAAIPHPTPRPPAKPTMMSQEARDLFLKSASAEEAALAWKERLYVTKLGVGTDPAARWAVVDAYMHGLHWVLEYYYRGVASWNWYYPYHYAPMASDLVDLEQVRISFTHGEPFLPYEQLLAVQPAASCQLLPAPYQRFMLDPDSPINFFYPKDFVVDLEGKKAEWEGVVLIPFIDEQKLLAVSRSIPPSALTPMEQTCNQHGSMVIFKHAGELTGETSDCSSTLPESFSNVTLCNSTVTRQPPLPPFPHGQPGFIPKIVPGTKMGKHAPSGFPTLGTLSVAGKIENAKCSVFGMHSKRPSLILAIKAPAVDVTPTAETLAPHVIGSRVWIRWPYLTEGLISCIGDETGRVPAAGAPVIVDPAWKENVEAQRIEFLEKRGVDIGPSPLWVEVRPLEVLVRYADGSFAKSFAEKGELVPLQLALRSNPSPDPRFDPDALQGGAALFEPGSRAVVGKGPYYGCLARVLGPGAGGEVGPGPRRAMSVSVEPPPPTAASAAKTALALLGGGAPRYCPAHQAAKQVGISPSALGRIAGSLYLVIGESRRDRLDVGLCVRNAKLGLCVPDAVRFVPPKQPPPRPQAVGEGPPAPVPKGSWEYSEALIKLLKSYKVKAPWLWAAVEQDAKAFELDASRVCPGETPEERLAAAEGLHAWLKRQPMARRPLVSQDAAVAPEAAVRMLQGALPPPGPPGPAVELTNVQPHMLIPPSDQGHVVYAEAGGAFQLGHRVVALGGTGVPPFGARGSVTALLPTAVEVVFDGPFAGGSDLGGRCAGEAGALCPPRDLLSLSRVRGGKPGWGTAAAAAAAAAAARPGQVTFVDERQAAAAATARGPPRRADNAPPASEAPWAGLAPVRSGGPGEPGAGRRAPRAREPLAPGSGADRGFAMGRGRGGALPGAGRGPGGVAPAAGAAPAPPLADAGAHAVDGSAAAPASSTPRAGNLQQLFAGLAVAAAGPCAPTAGDAGTSDVIAGQSVTTPAAGVARRAPQPPLRPARREAKDAGAAPAGEAPLSAAQLEARLEGADGTAPGSGGAAPGLASVPAAPAPSTVPGPPGPPMPFASLLGGIRGVGGAVPVEAARAPPAAAGPARPADAVTPLAFWELLQNASRAP
ncbi:XRN1 [Auxenochlorella protothecoides x Auxenochlorella symbiontica]